MVTDSTWTHTHTPLAKCTHTQLTIKPPFNVEMHADSEEHTQCWRLKCAQTELFVSYLNGLNVTRHLLTIILPSVQRPVIIFQNVRPLTSLLTSRPEAGSDQTSYLRPMQRSTVALCFTPKTAPRGAASLIREYRYKVSFSKSSYPCVRMSFKALQSAVSIHTVNQGEVAAGWLFRSFESNPSL